MNDDDELLYSPTKDWIKLARLTTEKKVKKIEAEKSVALRQGLYEFYLLLSSICNTRRVVKLIKSHL